MAKRSKKLEELSKMFDDNIDFEKINENEINQFIGIMKKVEDNRYQPNIKHLVSDILIITLFALMAKATEWTEIELVGKRHEKWFKKYLELPNGIPLHDTIQRVVSMIDSQKLHDLCIKHLIEIINIYVPKTETEKDVISLDGKTTNGSSRSALTTKKIRPVNTMSVYSHNYGLSLNQEYIGEKENEIKYGPKLLELFDLKNCIVTADALNTQKETVKTVIKQKGDYVFAIKGNQHNFYKNIKEYFNDEDLIKTIKDENTFKETEKSHSKIINRKYMMTNNINWLDEKDKWEGLKSIGIEIKTIESINTGETTIEKRYYLISFENDIDNFKDAVRKHWGIENNLHAPLDIVFKEDSNKTLEKNGAKNLGILRRIALSIFKIVKTYYKISMKLISLTLAHDFENEMENIFKLLDANAVKQLKNT